MLDKVGSPLQAVSQVSVVLQQLKNPCLCSSIAAIISGYPDDPWLLCHFHSTGLIAPNSGRFGGNRSNRQCMHLVHSW